MIHIIITLVRERALFLQNAFAFRERKEGEEDIFVLCEIPSSFLLSVMNVRFHTGRNVHTCQF